MAEVVGLRSICSLWEQADSPHHLLFTVSLRDHTANAKSFPVEHDELVGIEDETRGVLPADFLLVHLCEARNDVGVVNFSSIDKVLLNVMVEPDGLRLGQLGQELVHVLHGDGLELLRLVLDVLGELRGGDVGDCLTLVLLRADSI